jgi:fucokinase
MWSMLEMKLAMFTCIGEGLKVNNIGGVVVTCADDICVYDHKFVLDNISNMQHSGFVAFAHPSSIEIGQTHGVFVLPEEEISSKDGYIVCHCKYFIHKPSVEKMRRYGAIVNDNIVFTDSSYFFFPDVTELLLRFALQNSSISIELDCYGDFLCALGTNSDSNYINTESSKAYLQQQLYALLSGVSFQVICCRPSRFYHIGTMSEYIEHLATDTVNNKFMYEISGYQNAVCFLENPLNVSNCNFLQTVITGKDISSHFQPFTVIENSEIKFSQQTCLKFSGYSIISCIDISENDLIDQCNKLGLSLEVLKVPDNIFLQTIPVTDGRRQRRFMTFVIGINDDLKKQSASEQVRFFGSHKIVERFNNHLLDSDIWDRRFIATNSCSIWNAKIYPITDTEVESIAYALAIAKLSEIDIPNINLKEKDRMSFEDALLLCDVNYQIQRLAALNDANAILSLNRFFLRRNTDISTLSEQCPHVFATLKRKIVTCHLEEFYNYLESGLVKSDHHENKLETMRLKRCIAYLVKNTLLMHAPKESRALHHTAISKLVKESEDILKHTLCSPFLLDEFIIEEYRIPRILSGFSYRSRHPSYVTVKLPVRINLAGGWTDTPPYCLTHGGAVLNTSLKVNNKLPVRATAFLVPFERCGFKFVIEDDNETIESSLIDMVELFDISPTQQFGMHKSVVAFTLFPNICLLSEEERRKHDLISLGNNFFSYLSEKPVYIELRTKVLGIPRGSGLGTSSILIVAGMEALRQLLINQDETSRVIYPDYFESLLKNDIRCFEDAVNIGLAIEQVLSTGGGWQDQIGGMINGIKLIQSEPCATKTHTKIPSLSYSLKCLTLHEKKRAHFNERMLVVFTGRQRLAKGVLTNVVENHIVSFGNTNDILAELKAVTHRMAELMQRWFSDPNHDECLLQQIGEQLSNVRDLNIKLSMTTSHSMEPLFNRLKQMTYGTCMIGAGSGGYIIGILRPEFTKLETMNFLLSEYPNVSQCLASI